MGKGRENEERLFLIPMTCADNRCRTVLGIGEESTIGRAGDNAVVLPDERVSKYHARIVRRDGTYAVRDEGSLNGTYLNGVPVPAAEGARIAEGDIVRVGTCEFRAAVRRTPPASEFDESGLSAYVAPPQTLANLVERLSPFAGEYMAHVAGQPSEKAGACVERYLHEPLAAVRRQNAYAAERLREDGGDPREPADVPASVAEDLIVLNAWSEELAHPEARAADDVNPERYESLTNVAFLLHGDILPSHLSRLDDTSTFHFRELLVVHKYRTGLFGFLRKARAIGICRHEEIAGGEHLLPARAVFGVCAELYSAEEEGERFQGDMKTLGYFAERGGACRHRSGALQLMLQEAGIPSRYVRGLLMGSGLHAWCEVALGGGDVLVLDPTFSVYGVRAGLHRLNREGPDVTPGRRVTFYLRDAVGLGSTKPNHLAYIGSEGYFNTVWRPRRHDIA